MNYSGIQSLNGANSALVDEGRAVDAPAMISYQSQRLGCQINDKTFGEVIITKKKNVGLTVRSNNIENGLRKHFEIETLYQ